MIGALAASELNTLILVVGILVLLGAAYAAYLRKLPEAVIIAVIGLILLFVAS